MTWLLRGSLYFAVTGSIKFAEEGKMTEYTLHYKKVKNITLRITAQGHVEVTAPYKTDKKRVEQFIQQKQQWIAQHQQKIAQLQQQRDQQGLHNQYVDGGQIAYLGQMYPLHVEQQGKRGWQWDQTELLVQGCSDEDQCRQMVEAFYRTQLSAVILPQLDLAVRQRLQSLSLPQPEFTVRKMRASWGLCYSRSHKIVLNLWLAMAPPDCIQQVLIHEYLHFCQSNHGPQFYALMERFVPEYRQLKQQLSVLVDLRELAE